MATQKVPLTRLDETGASEGEVLKYTSGALSWETGGGGGTGTAFKNTVLGTESVSVNSLEQYQVHSGLEILSGGSFTIKLSGDLVLDAPDDPHKAAGWTDSGNVIHTTDNLNTVVIGQTTALSTDDMLSVAGGNVTVAGSVSAQGDVYGNARTMTNPGMVLQVVESVFNLGGTYHTSTATSFTHAFSGAITPTSTSSKILIQADIMLRVTKASSGAHDSATVVANVDRLDPSDGSTVWQAISGDAEQIQGNRYAVGTSNAGHGWTVRRNDTTNTWGGGVISIMRLDSPASTDELVYDVVARMVDSSTQYEVYDGQMIMQEIAG